MRAIKECAQSPGLNAATQFSTAWTDNFLPSQAEDGGLWNDSWTAFQKGLAEVVATGGTFDEPMGSVGGVAISLPWMMATKNGLTTSHSMLRFAKSGLTDTVKLLKPILAGSQSVRVVNLVHVMSDDAAQVEPTGARWIGKTDAYSAAINYSSGNQQPKRGNHCGRCAYLTICPARPM